MTVWALSDPHLCFGAADKSMEVFGPEWAGYAEKIKENWLSIVKADDLILIPGDISWAMRLEEALADLQWIDALPGTKVMIKGNHDYWWSSLKKLRELPLKSIHFIANNAFDFGDISIGGSRLWDTTEYSFSAYTNFQENPREAEKTLSKEEELEQNQKIFNRELERLSLSLKQLNPKAKVRIAMTHYPPIGADLKPSAASKILEDFQIDICVFGHLHSIKNHSLNFGTARGVTYYFTSCDYLDFKPLKIL
jgi:uncharacterized protein